MAAEQKWASVVVGAVAGAALAHASYGCARNVSQDAHSGKDARHKGAQKIKVEDGEGQSRRDVVTYPGGDRVDWKMFEIPEGKSGTLKVKLRWRPARPDLDLAFEVYDQYLHRIGRGKPSPGTGARSKRVTIKHAAGGAYYVQVYAPRRMDAGTYRVTVQFKEVADQVAVAGPREIPDPPILPAVPEAPELAPEGAGTGGADGVGAGGPGAEGAGGVDGVDETPPEPGRAIQPVVARVVKIQVSTGGSLTITVDKGKNAGVESGWKGQVLGASGQPLGGGEFTVQRVTGAEATGKVSMSVDQIRANNKILLSPP